MMSHLHAFAARLPTPKLMGQRWLAAVQDLIVHWRTSAPRLRPRLPATRPMRHVAASVALLICLSVLVSAAYVDEPLTRALVHTPGSVRSVFEAITKIGNSGWIFALSALVALGALAMAGPKPSTWNTGLKVLAARATFVFVLNAGSGLFSQFLKHVLGRARPKYIDLVGPYHFDWFSFHAASASMPSGHSITAFAIGTAMATFVPRGRWIFYAIATAVAVSRVVIGAHYMSDVVAGSAIGFASCLLLQRLCASKRIIFVAAPSTTPAATISDRLRGERCVARLIQLVFAKRA